MPQIHSIFPDVALEAFKSANPIDFNLYDDEGQQAIYILNDQAPGRTHHLLIANNGDQDLVFQSTSVRRRHIPASDNHHFELRFRPGTLDEDFLSWISVGTTDWRLHAEKISVTNDGIQDGTVALYLLYFGEETLTLPAGQTILLILDNVKAGVGGGSRGSRLELRYQIGYLSNGSQQILTTDLEAYLEQNLLQPFLAHNPNHAVKNSKKPFVEFGQEMNNALIGSGLNSEIAVLNAFLALDHEALHYRQERLQIISNRGRKELPMIAAFEGSSTVLNDGTTANRLTLQISNLLQNSKIRLGARDSERPTKFILSFDTSEEQAAWALCDPDNAAAIDVGLHFEGLQGTNWQIRPELQGENPQWIITLLDDIDILVGEYFHLHLDGLKTSMPSGFTNLYLLYENIPGFWDGRFVLPIEKSPLKFDDQKSNQDPRDDGHFIQRTKVGIGNTEPVDTLDVNGGMQSETLVLRNGGKATFPLDVAGTIKAKGLQLEGPLSSDQGLAAKSLTLSKTPGQTSVVVTEESGNLKVSGRLMDSTGFVIPPGGIIMWSGKTAPAGWALCDGSNGTPDLRGRFIVGYNGSQNKTSPVDINDSSYNQPGNLSDFPKAPVALQEGNTGGSKTVTLDKTQIPSHSHSATTSGQDGGHSHALRLDTGTGGSFGGGKMLHMTNIAGQMNGVTIDNVLANDTVPIDGGGHGHTITVGDTGGGAAHENRPPFYVLAFIMKL